MSDVLDNFKQRGLWSDARMKDYRIDLSISVDRGGEAVELTQATFDQHGLSKLTDNLEIQLRTIYGDALDPEPLRLWRRRLQVLRGSLSYYNGKHGTFRLPVTINGEHGWIRLIARRLPLEQDSE